MGTSIGAEESKQPALAATVTNGQGLVEIKPEPAADPSPPDEAAAGSQAAPELASAAAAPVKAEPEAAVKQEAPIPAANGPSAVKAEPLNGASEISLAAPAAAAGLPAQQQDTQVPQEPAQGEAGMQNGAPAVKPEEELKQEGTAHTGHESEEESDLEDEEEEHDNQVWSLRLPGKLGDTPDGLKIQQLLGHRGQACVFHFHSGLPHFPISFHF